jgi:Ca2+-binding EF-hand superfamily protein
MKHAILGATLSLAVAGAAVSAAAGTAKTDPVDHEMKMMDTNGDGKVSAEEHAAGAGRMFATIDANRDGRVTAAEMGAAHERVTGHKPAKGEMGAAEKIKVIDTDGDGALTAEEHRAGSKKMFDLMDANKDGALTREEMSAGQAMKMQRAPR